MRRLLPLLLAAALAAQDAGDSVTLLLKGGTSAHGWIVRVERDGVRLRMDCAGEPVERLWTWDQIDDAEPLKTRSGACTTPAPGVLAGVEVVEGARRVRGVVDSRSTDLLVVRNREGTFRFDPARAQVADAWIAEREVLTDAELEQRLAPSGALVTAEDHRRAGAEAARLGFDDRANDLFRMAEVVADEGRLDHPLLRQIAAVRAGGTERARGIWDLRRKLLDQSYEEAIALLDHMEATDPGGGRDLEPLRAGLERLRDLPVAARIALFRDAAAAETLWALARDAGTTWDGASTYVREQLASELARRTAARFSVDEGSARRAWEERATAGHRAASWGPGSFLAGQATVAQCEEWWEGAAPEDRWQALRALFAELTGEGVEVLTKDCPGCGGRGKALDSDAPCPRCKGRGKERVVLYR